MIRPVPTTVTTTTEVVDGETRVTNIIRGTTISTVCVVNFVDNTLKNNGLKGDYEYWDQPVQDVIDGYTVEGTSNYISVINVKNQKLFSFKFPSLISMQRTMDNVGRKYGFPCPRFDVVEIGPPEDQDTQPVTESP